MTLITSFQVFTQAYILTNGNEDPTGTIVSQTIRDFTGRETHVSHLCALLLGGNPAHRRTFTRIAIAAGAEHHRQPAGRAAQSLQNLLQRPRLVRIVDQGQEVLAAVDSLEPSGNLGVPQSS